MGRRTKLQAGERFDRWEVIRIAYKKPQVYYTCRCDCGRIKNIRGGALLQKQSRSCGYCGMRSGPRNVRLKKDGWKATVTHLYGRYKHNAKKRNYPFSLTLSEFLTLIQQPCYYCGTPPKNKLNVYLRQDQAVRSGSDGVRTEHANTCWIRYNGIDRKDSLVGYLPSNCVAACSLCNYAKRDWPYSEFMEWVHRLATHQGFYKCRN